MAVSREAACMEQPYMEQEFVLKSGYAGGSEGVNIDGPVVDAHGWSGASEHN